MAVVIQSNNRVLPANQRAADVASLAVENIAPIQAQKIQAAFRVQGIEACLYNRLYSGQICTCHAAGKPLNSRLNKDGKASIDTINGIMLGSQFGFQDFGIIEDQSESYTAQQQGILSEGTELVPKDTVTLDDLVGDFDAFAIECACPVCFGTGFVGGYTLFGGYRKVHVVQDFNLPAIAEIAYDAAPWSVKTYSASIKTLIPKGIVGIDAFRCMNGTNLADYQLFIDGKKLTYNEVIRCADGRNHEITLLGNKDSEFTHLEIQFNMSNESVYFEVPKLTKGSDLNNLVDLQNFQLLMSPLVPHVNRIDIITESMWGYALMVQQTSLLNTRERQMLGWECDVRVIQPEELYNLLPKRQRVATTGRHVNPVLGNRFNRP